jgi:hypothetical protein
MVGPIQKTADAKGRIGLGKALANRLVQVEARSDGSYVITPGIFVPEREAWVYKNSEAWEQLSRGLQESRDGAAPVQAPDLNADAEAFSDTEE